MTVFSLVMIYSASIAYAAAEGGTQFSFVGDGNVYPVYGGHMLAAFFFAEDELLAADYSVLFCCLGLLLLLVLFVGREINGATRWIHIGPLNLQPTEFSNWRRSCICPACLRAVKKCCAI